MASLRKPRTFWYMPCIDALFLYSFRKGSIWYMASTSWLPSAAYVPLDSDEDVSLVGTCYPARLFSPPPMVDLSELPRITEAVVDEVEGNPDNTVPKEVYDRLRLLMEQMGARIIKTIVFPGCVKGGRDSTNNNPDGKAWFSPPFNFPRGSAVYAYATDASDPQIIMYHNFRYAFIGVQRDLDGWSSTATRFSFPFSSLPPAQPERPAVSVPQRRLLLGADLFIPDLSPKVEALLKKIGDEIKDVMVLAMPHRQRQCEQTIRNAPSGSAPILGKKRATSAQVSEASFAPHHLRFGDQPLFVNEWTVFASTNRDIRLAALGERADRFEVISGIEGSWTVREGEDLQRLLQAARLHQSFGKNVNFEDVSPEGLLWYPRPTSEPVTASAHHKRRRRRGGRNRDGGHGAERSSKNNGIHDSKGDHAEEVMDLWNE